MMRGAEAGDNLSRQLPATLSLIMDLRLTIFIVCIFNPLSDQLLLNYTSEVDQRDCKLTYTYGYGYNKYYHVTESGGHNGRELTIRFFVRARSDAHILLSPDPYPGEFDPVYEIVLGAGKNTFSDIRRRLRTLTRATAATPDLLSFTELRAFWVHVDGKGLVRVGKEGEDTPFLFWHDPNPLDIRYFSFCTWTGVTGKWLYGCPIVNDTEKIEVVEEIPKTMTEKLRKNLLTDYDPFAVPLLHTGHRIPVFLHLTYHHVQLDVKRSVFSIDGTMPMHWIDEKIQWNPEDYGGLTSLHVKEHEVWLPQVILHNSAGDGTKILGHAGMTITSRGAVMWSPSTHLEVWCDVRLESWPQDEHVCELHLGFWTQRDFLELLSLDNETVLEDEHKTGSEWKVVNVETEMVITVAPWMFDEDYDTFLAPADSLSIRFTIRRQGQFYTAVFLSPLIVIWTLMFLIFWIAPRNFSRTGILCASLVITSLLMVSISNSLPAPPDHVPNLVWLYSLAMKAEVMILLMSILVICITRYQYETLPPGLVCTFLKHPISQKMLLLPKVTSESGRKYSHLEENGDTSETSPEEAVTTAEEIQHWWNVLSIAVDRICCLVYSLFVIVVAIKCI